jgi:hypothetical protein
LDVGAAIEEVIGLAPKPARSFDRDGHEPDGWQIACRSNRIDNLTRSVADFAPP